MNDKLPNAGRRTPEALLDQLEAAGAKLTRKEDGVVKVAGKLPPNLLAALREQRAAVIEAWERRRLTDRHRYGRVPPADAPMLAREMDLPQPWREAVVAHVLRQPRPVHAWVMARANDYFEHGVKADDCDWRACVDVIAWQRNCDGQAAVEFAAHLRADEAMDIKATDGR